ncbi:MAG: MotA/TolQ/ExbB proton channel family protein, partial [Clostridia bacterium]|nr:MotA/TolQ/ExbB proton channel family protein [Clostridia bacterium]
MNLSTVVFLILMLAVAVYAVALLVKIGKSIRTMEAVNKRLTQPDYCALLKRQNEQRNENGRKWLFADSVGELFEAEKAFHGTLCRVSSGNSEEDCRYPDIGEYFGQELTDKIAHSHISENLPSVLTGLGILGTFVGLILGIVTFDQSSSEAIVGSIDKLLGGMSTAFVTSIAGVTLSLLFSSVYKWMYSALEWHLESFVAAYRENVLDGSSAIHENRLLQVQKEQTELLKGVANSIAVSVSESIHDRMAPFFGKLDETIARFCQLASEQQRNGVAEMVDGFMTSLNTAVGDNFKELSEVLSDMCDFQRQSTMQMRQTVDEICHSTQTIAKVNEASEKMLADMSGYIESVRMLQQYVNEEVLTIKEQLDQNRDAVQRQKEYIEQLVEYESRIASLSDSVKRQAELAEETVMHMDETCRKSMDALCTHADETMRALSSASDSVIGKTAESVRETIANAERAAEGFVASVEVRQREMLDAIAEQQTAMFATMATGQKALADETAEYYGKMTAAAQEQQTAMLTTVADKQKQISDEMSQLQKGAAERQKALAAETAEYYGKMTAAAQEQQTAMLTAVTESQKKLLNDVSVWQGKMYDTLKGQMEMLNKITGRTSGDLGKAASVMNEASEKLGKSMKESLVKTFEVFDKELAEITKRLSGTIAEIRDTTNTIPLLIQHSQKNYGETLDALNENTQRY